MHAYMHAYMTRVISLSDESYASLKALKKEKESFTDVVMRLAYLAKKKSLMDLAGKWVGSKEETDRIFEEIYADRKKFRTRTVEF